VRQEPLDARALGPAGTRVTIDGAHFEDLMRELEEAVTTPCIDRDESLWGRSRPTTRHHAAQSEEIP
jgi:hypothetical protein